jgi:membrane fusion protein (multidrug efflux system)
VGLSMDTEVDVSKQDGKSLADAQRPAAVAQTTVFNTFDKGADAEVQRVIAANLGRGGVTNVARTSKGRAVTAAPALAKLTAASTSH